MLEYTHVALRRCKMAARRSWLNAMNTFSNKTTYSLNIARDVGTRHTSSIIHSNSRLFVHGDYIHPAHLMSRGRSVAVGRGRSRSVVVSRGQSRSVAVGRGRSRSVAVGRGRSRSVVVGCRLEVKPLTNAASLLRGDVSLSRHQFVVFPYDAVDHVRLGQGRRVAEVVRLPSSHLAQDATHDLARTRLWQPRRHLAYNKQDIVSTPSNFMKTSKAPTLRRVTYR